MAKYNKIVQNSFFGGISEFQKSGVEQSARMIRNLNIHEDPNYITQTQTVSKVSGSTVTGLVSWIVDGTPWDTNRYFYDRDGKMYKETSGGTWSNIFTANASVGNGLLVFDDYLYYTSHSEFSRYGKLSGTPSNSQAFISSDGVSNIDQSRDTSGNTYALTTSINEGATHRNTFTPTKDPISQISVLVAAKGTGDWTLTVHDSNNVLIGYETISNASLTNSTDNYFGTWVGQSQLKIQPNNPYHFHLTSTVADGTVTTTSANNLETVDYHEYYGILYSDLDFHPMVEMDGDIIIGNGRYLAKWSDQSVYDPNAVILPAGYRVRTLCKIDEYVVAGCWKGDDIDSVESGRLYYWDNIESTYNFFVETTSGLPNAIHNSKNRLFSILGSRGTMYLGSSPFQQIGSIPNLARGKKVEVYPGAVCEWQGNTMIGVSASTDDASLYQGVYQWGNSDDKYPESLTLAFNMSTGSTQDTDAQIGCVASFGKDLYFSWRSGDGTTYGVDKVIKTNGAYNGGAWESLIFDDGNPAKSKMAGRLIITFEALTTGQSVTPKYKIDRATSFTSGSAESTVGATRLELPINLLFKEIEWGFSLASSSNTNIIITGVIFEYDSLLGEDETS